MTVRGTYTRHARTPENDLRRLREYVRNPYHARGVKHDNIYVFPTTWLDDNLRTRLERAKVIRRIDRGTALRSRGVEASEFGLRYLSNLFYETDATIIDQEK